jgi:hypothetical protein
VLKHLREQLLRQEVVGLAGRSDRLHEPPVEEIK